MARVHSKHTVIKLGGNDISADCNTSTYSRAIDSHDNTTYGKDDHVYNAGLGNGTAQIGGKYNSAVGTGPRDVIQGLLYQTTEFIRQVEGAGSGKPQDRVDVVITSYVETSPIADYVAWSADLQLSDAIDDTPQA